MACLAFIFSFEGAKWHLRSLLVLEMFVCALGGVTCTCYFMQGLCVVAALPYACERNEGQLGRLAPGAILLLPQPTVLQGGW